MSAFGTPGSEGRILRERGFPTQPLRPVGIDETLHAPGVEPQPLVVSDGMRLAEDLSRALGLVGDAFGRTAASVELERRQQAKLDQEYSDLWEGQANRDLQSWVPARLQDIADNKIVAGDDINEQVNSLIGSAFTDAFPDAYRAKFSERATGLLTNALLEQRSKIKTEARDQNLAILSHGLDEPGTTSARAMQILATGRKLAPNMPDSEFYGATVLPAAERAANAADSDRLKALLGVLPAEYATERQKLETTLARNVDAKRRLNESAATDQVFGVLNRVRSNQATYKQASDLIESMRLAGQIDEQTAFRLGETVQSQQASDSVQITKEADQTAYNEQVDTYKTYARQWMTNGAKTGGASSLPEKFTVVYPSGKEPKKIDRDEIITAIVGEQFAEIDKVFTDPVQNIAHKADFLAQQGGAATFAPWKSTLNGAVSQATSNEIAAGNAPPALVQSVALYNQLQAMGAVGVLNNHLTDEESRNYLRTVSLIQKHLRGASGSTAAIGADGPTIQQALAQASKVSASRAFSTKFQRTVSPDRLDKAAATLAGDLGVQNVEDLRASLAEKAEMYRVMNGYADEEVIAQAVEDAKQDFGSVDGAAAFTRGRQIPQNMNGEIVPLLKEMYVDANGQAQGVTADNLRVRLDGRSGAVYVTDQSGNTAPNADVLTLDEVNAFNSWLGTIAAAEERKRIGSGRTTMIEDVRDIARRAAALAVGSNPTGYNPFLVSDALRPNRKPTREEIEQLSAQAEEATEIPAGTPPPLESLMRFWLARRASGNEQVARGRAAMAEIPPIRRSGRELRD